MTVLETALLFFGGMSLFDALCHTFGTLATGGFSTKNASIGHFGSAYIHYVIIIFMLIIILLTTGLGEENRHKVQPSRRVKGAAVAIGLLFGLLYTLYRTPSELIQSATHRAAPVTMDDIGFRLLSTDNGFIIPFEVISILLLVALVGAVVIARKDRKEGEQA